MKNRQFVLAVILASSFALPAGSAEPDASAKVGPDVVYGHKDGLAMTMDIFRPKSVANQATILLIMSGGWHSGRAPPERIKPLFQPCLDRGYTVAAVGHGSSPRYSIPEAVSDARQAVRFFRRNAEQLGVDADRLGAMGMSAGGHLALMLGASGDAEVRVNAHAAFMGV